MRTNWPTPSACASRSIRPISLSLSGYKTWERQVSVKAGTTEAYPPVELVVADGTVEVEAQNNANVGVCPTNRHTVRLHYTEALDELDFGGLPVGLSVQKTIRVENIGSTDLEIYSVTSDAPEFVPVVQDTRVAPDGTTGVTVTFTPSSASTFAGVVVVAMASRNPRFPASSSNSRTPGRRSTSPPVTIAV